VIAYIALFFRLMMGFRFKVTDEAGICLTTTQKAIKRSAPVTAPFDSLFLFDDYGS